MDKLVLVILGTTFPVLVCHGFDFFQEIPQQYVVLLFSLLKSDQYDPCLVDSLRDVNVRQIACGSGHTVVLSTEGDVYSWGRGDDGRLGK